MECLGLPIDEVYCYVVDGALEEGYFTPPPIVVLCLFAKPKLVVDCYDYFIYGLLFSFEVRAEDCY